MAAKETDVEIESSTEAADVDSEQRTSSSSDVQSDERASDKTSNLILSTKCHPVYTFVHGGLEMFFDWLGVNIATRPKTWICGSLAFILIAAFGLIPMEQVVNLDRAWWPHETAAFKQREFIDRVYPGKTENLQLLAVHRGNDPTPGVLQPAILEELMAIHEIVVALPGFHRICDQDPETQTCPSTSLPAVWGYEKSRLPASASGVLATVNDLPLRTPAGQIIPVNSTIGSIQWDGSSNITGAKALSAFYPLNAEAVSSTRYLDFQQRFIDAMRKLRTGGTLRESAKAGDIQAAKLSAIADKSLQFIDLEFLAPRSINDESDRIVEKDTPLISVAVVIMIVYVSISLGGKPFKNSRIALSLFSVSTIGASLLCGFGIGGYFGNPFNVMSQLAIFVVMGIGVGM
eukprot:gb/GECG01005704.1/.p1 GENE.gb/GECG01005704.1/~~gb/GECG01005704.1/.p1  ORF type:complete len:403 (+),score=46.94 gb/GECG01005704.1/:1-1209(+)